MALTDMYQEAWDIFNKTWEDEDTEEVVVKYPHKCFKCGSASLEMFTDMYCSNKGCEDYHEVT